ncbi:MAG: hypothetical protein ACJ8J0_11830, partial [Longimicrobiaceae bacterium]
RERRLRRAVQAYDSAMALEALARDTANLGAIFGRRGMAANRRGRWIEAIGYLNHAASASGQDRQWWNLELCAAMLLATDQRARQTCYAAGEDKPDTTNIQAALRTMLRDISVVNAAQGEPLPASSSGPPRSFRIISRLDPTANALRVWEWTGDNYVETLPNGSRTFYTPDGRQRVNGEDGTVLKSSTGDLRVWVPDGPNRGPAGPPLRFQTRRGEQVWEYLGPMISSAFEQ